MEKRGREGMPKESSLKKKILKCFAFSVVTNQKSIINQCKLIKIYTSKTFCWQESRAGQSWDAESTSWR